LFDRVAKSNPKSSFKMANIQSQKKRNRQNEVRRQRNKSVSSDLKTSIKKVEVAAAAGEPTEELLKSAQRTIDKAASKGTLHKKTAARKKSRLAKLAS
jgi:small subunit ribosomal protein S20